MPTRKTLPKVRFVKEYTNWAGNRFRMYEAPDGLRTDVRIRTGWKGPIEYTNAEAKTAAARELDRLHRAGWSGRR